MKVIQKDVKSILTKSKLPSADFVINPYVGCTHKCIYCYACFMHRFNDIDIKWGEYLIVKNLKEDFLKNKEKVAGKTILLSSVTDPYQPINKKYKKTNEILMNLIETDANIEILTKSDSILQDIELIKKLKHITVGISLCTIDDDISKVIEPGATISSKRINALKYLHDSKIKCYVFISPIIPFVTDVYSLIDQLAGIVDYFCFENLNLRGSYRKEVYSFIESKYPHLFKEFTELYQDSSRLELYWNELEERIKMYCDEKHVNYKLYFNHSVIKKK